MKNLAIVLLCIGLLFSATNAVAENEYVIAKNKDGHPYILGVNVGSMSISRVIVPDYIPYRMVERIVSNPDKLHVPDKSCREKGRANFFNVLQKCFWEEAYIFESQTDTFHIEGSGSELVPATDFPRILLLTGLVLFSIRLLTKFISKVSEGDSLEFFSLTAVLFCGASVAVSSGVEIGGMISMLFAIFAMFANSPENAYPEKGKKYDFNLLDICVAGFCFGVVIHFLT